MRTCLVLVVVLVALCAPADAAREPRAQRLFAQWKAADADGDGALSRAEAAAVPSLAAHFEAIDANRDGRIDADEVRVWRLSRAAKRRAGRPAAPSALDQAFSAADADGDGELSRAETRAALPRIAGKFERMDLDRSGRLSRAEVDAWLARRRAARRP